MDDTGKAVLFSALLALAACVTSPGQAQDVVHGESVFKVCAACHGVDHTNRAGPGLQGIIGRTAGTSPGFRYSRAMKKSGIVWDEKSLDAYLAAPQKVIPGNRMPFAGLNNADDRAGVIGYLSSLR